MLSGTSIKVPFALIVYFIFFSFRESKALQVLMVLQDSLALESQDPR